MAHDRNNRKNDALNVLVLNRTSTARTATVGTAYAAETLNRIAVAHRSVNVSECSMGAGAAVLGAGVVTIDLVILPGITTIGRQTALVMAFLRKAVSQGIRVISVNDGIDTNNLLTKGG